jgi:hypothetical protein
MRETLSVKHRIADAARKRSPIAKIQLLFWHSTLHCMQVRFDVQLMACRISGGMFFNRKHHRSHSRWWLLRHSTATVLHRKIPQTFWRGPSAPSRLMP